MPSEAQSRITINKLLEEAGWRFLPDAQGRRENINLSEWRSSLSLESHSTCESLPIPHAAFSWLIVSSPSFPANATASIEVRLTPNFHKNAR